MSLIKEAWQKSNDEQADEEIESEPENSEATNIFGGWLEVSSIFYVLVGTVFVFSLTFWIGVQLGPNFISFVKDLFSSFI